MAMDIFRGLFYFGAVQSGTVQRLRFFQFGQDGIEKGYALVVVSGFLFGPGSVNADKESANGRSVRKILGKDGGRKRAFRIKKDVDTIRCFDEIHTVSIIRDPPRQKADDARPIVGYDILKRYDVVAGKGADEFVMRAGAVVINMFPFRGFGGNLDDGVEFEIVYIINIHID